MCADGQAQGWGVGADYRLQIASKEDKLPFSLGWETRAWSHQGHGWMQASSRRVFTSLWTADSCLACQEKNPIQNQALPAPNPPLRPDQIGFEREYWASLRQKSGGRALRKDFGGACSQHIYLIDLYLILIEHLLCTWIDWVSGTSP